MLKATLLKAVVIIYTFGCIFFSPLLLQRLNPTRGIWIPPTPPPSFLCNTWEFLPFGEPLQKLRVNSSIHLLIPPKLRLTL